MKKFATLAAVATLTVGTPRATKADGQWVAYYLANPA